MNNNEFSIENEMRQGFLSFHKKEGRESKGEKKTSKGLYYSS